uniref:Uncharacterized protein n=1 Tax=Medicago truncatula TaxID=3880 RepID=Q2HRN0_MEDTR|nr:hypothetical protein MtrDRAFT_AC158464g27v2 [Medicago truncatula]
MISVESVSHSTCNRIVYQQDQTVINSKQLSNKRITDDTTLVTTSVHIKFKFTGWGSLKFVAAIWWIWRWRNNIVLGDKTWKASDVIRQINLVVEDMVLLSTTNNRSKVYLWSII